METNIISRHICCRNSPRTGRGTKGREGFRAPRALSQLIVLLPLRRYGAGDVGLCRPPSTGPSRAAYIAAQHSRHSRAVHSCKARLQLACLGDALHACLTVSSVVGSKPVAFQLRAEHGAYPLVFRVGNFRILPLFLGGRLPNWVMTEGLGFLTESPGLLLEEAQPRPQWPHGLILRSRAAFVHAERLRCGDAAAALQ